MTPEQEKSYLELLTFSKKLYTFSSVSSLLVWDQEIHMPEKGIELRSLQQSYLSAFIHKEKISQKFENLLKPLISLKTENISFKPDSPDQKRIVELLASDHLHDKKVSEEFTEKFSAATSQSVSAWAKAREENRFADFAPHLEAVLELSREKAEMLGYSEHSYHALLDVYEPNISLKRIDSIFKNLKTQLISLLQKIKEKPLIENSFLFDSYPVEKQWDFAVSLVKYLKIPKSCTDFSQSTHPFTLGFHPHDVRFTTRIYPKDLMTNIGSTLHEGGHALYELGLPTQYFGTPLCEPASFAIHESQSRLWEVFIGKNIHFWTFLYPKLQKFFPQQLGKISLKEFYRGLHQVKPNMIRVESDEICYCLHIILRYEIEKDLIARKITVYDIPEIWREKMKEYFGIVPKNDREGCLQDIHWAWGYFGYFPTYALGNLYAAQFFAKLHEDLPDFHQCLEEGNFQKIIDWLTDKVFRHGRYYPAEDLGKKITDKALSEKAYLSYLTKKYEKIYGE